MHGLNRIYCEREPKPYFHIGSLHQPLEEAVRESWYHLSFPMSIIKRGCSRLLGGFTPIQSHMEACDSSGRKLSDHRGSRKVDLLSWLSLPSSSLRPEEEPPSRG